MAEQDEPVPDHASSTGQAFTNAAWLDDHFTMARPEYEAQLRAVGIRPGWHVLDAASGSGSFLPWRAELVGTTGRLAALDLAPDNTAEVERRLVRSPLPAPVEATTGTLLALPTPTATSTPRGALTPRSTSPTPNSTWCWASYVGWCGRAAWWRSRNSTVRSSASPRPRRS